MLRVCIIMSGIELPIIQCPRCGHKWVPRTAQPLHCPNCNCRLRKGDEGLQRSLLASRSGSSRGMGSEYPKIDPLHADFEQIQKDVEAVRDQHDEDSDVLDDHYVLGEILGVAGSISLPAPPLAKKIVEMAKLNAPQLRQEIEIVDAEIEKRQEAKRIVAETYEREKLTKAMWNRRQVTIISKELGPLRSFGVSSLEQVEELLSLAAEMTDALDNRITHFTKLREACVSRLKILNETNPKINAEKLCEIQRIIKEAADLKKLRVKTVAAYRKKGTVNDKNAVKYSKATERFVSLQNQYSSLYSEISHANSASQIPAFPILSVDEAGGERAILEVAKHAGQFHIPNTVKKGLVNTD